MEELTKILETFGTQALTGVIIYKLIEFLEIIVVFGMIGLGIKKAWPHFKKIMEG
jgi:hypothetical protein